MPRSKEEARRVEKQETTEGKMREVDAVLRQIGRAHV